MKYKAFNLDRLRAILTARGLKDRDLVKMMYGPKSHQTFQSIFTKQFGVQKLIDVCNALQIPSDSLFDIEDEGREQIPAITGNFNNVNSTVINYDLATLRSENEALKVLIKEKDNRIADLQNSVEILNAILKDKNRTDSD